jgi:hypothetical protein
MALSEVGQEESLLANEDGTGSHLQLIFQFPRGFLPLPDEFDDYNIL